MRGEKVVVVLLMLLLTFLVSKVTERKSTSPNSPAARTEARERGAKSQHKSEERRDNVSPVSIYQRAYEVHVRSLIAPVACTVARIR